MPSVAIFHDEIYIAHSPVFLNFSTGDPTSDDPNNLGFRHSNLEIRRGEIGSNQFYLQ